MKYSFVRRSSNKKVGPIPVTYTSEESCPASCPLMNAGCYAELGPVSLQWKKANNFGVGFDTLLRQIKALPKGTLWRHNIAGDLPGVSDSIDQTALDQLAYVNTGKRGFTYTHKPVLGGGVAWHNYDAVKEAVEDGFVINLSANDLDHADQLAELGIAPVVVLLPRDSASRLTTPAGRKVVVCPADTRGITCEECQVCANAHRKSIIGFRAHGSRAAKAGRIAMKEAV